MPTASRTIVFRVLSGEREYQDAERRRGRYGNDPLSVGDYLTVMRRYLEKADAAFTDCRGTMAAMEIIRKITAVGVACMENHGAPARKGFGGGRLDFATLHIEMSDLIICTETEKKLRVRIPAEEVANGEEPVANMDLQEASVDAVQGRLRQIWHNHMPSQDVVITTVYLNGTQFVGGILSGRAITKADIVRNLFAPAMGVTGVIQPFPPQPFMPPAMQQAQVVPQFNLANAGSNATQQQLQPMQPIQAIPGGVQAIPGSTPAL